MSANDRSPGPAGMAGHSAPGSDPRAGVAAAVLAYSLWGFLPFLFKALEAVAPVAVVANRVVFALVFVAGVIALRRGFGAVCRAFGNRKVVIAMLISTALIAVNWLTFIWGVSEGRVLEISFGYFINPMVSVGIGVALLGERLGRLQYGAVAVALVAVAVQSAELGSVPWVALVLAFSFGIYGYVRKVAEIGSITGLFIETLLLAPLALIYIAWTIGFADGGTIYADPALLALLVLTGPATAVPLLLFGFAARQLKLSTIGMLQYLAPTLQFIFAITVFGEDLTVLRLVSFALIWVALVLFTLGGRRREPAISRP